MSAAATDVLVVEDDPTMREELVRILDGADDFVVSSVAPDAASALAAGTVAMAVVDIGLPDASGIEVIRELAARDPAPLLMAHTIFEDRRTVFDALVAGADSYVLKGGGGDAFLAALRQLREGGAPMSPRVARFVVEAFRSQGKVADRYTLTGRERQVLIGLEEGLSYKEVAAELHISRHTVHTHIKRIYEKLHAHSREEALAKARLRGML